ncbi:MAG: DUF4440 domain-containing protein [Planctomycetota bacterium]
MNVEEHLLEQTQELLNSIAKGDWETYCRLCSKDLTCFEPEAVGNLIHGLDFHKFYFDIAQAKDPENPEEAVQTTIASPFVRVSGSSAIVCYLRVIQKGNPPQTFAFEETRIWECQEDNTWKHVHFHRSGPQTWNV